MIVEKNASESNLNERKSASFGDAIHNVAFAGLLLMTRTATSAYCDRSLTV